MEEKLMEILRELREKKTCVPGPLARGYAVMATDLEKGIAFYLIYVKEDEAKYERR